MLFSGLFFPFVTENKNCAVAQFAREDTLLQFQILLA